MPQINSDGSLSLEVVFSENERELAIDSTILLGVVLGFDKSDDGLVFKKTLANKNEFASVLGEVRRYLDKTRYGYEADEKAEKAFQDLEKMRRLREMAVRGEIKTVRWADVKPEEFKRTLLPYQVDSAEHMITQPNAANFSVPGSGKTTIAYAAFSALRKMGKIDRLLVVCPTSAFQPWEEEYLGCFGRPPGSSVMRITGQKIRRDELYVTGAEGYDILLISYGTLINDVAMLRVLLDDGKKTMLILDESHKVKNPDGVTSRACRVLAPYVEKRAILTGTPVTNTLMDVWSQITFLWPDKKVLGMAGEFELRSSSRSGMEWTKTRLAKLYKRIKKGDLNLPKPVVRTKMVKMGEHQAKIYGAIAGRVLRQIADPDERGTLVDWKRAALVRLMQAAVNPSLLMEKSLEFGVPALDGDASFMDVVRSYSKYETPPKFEETVRLTRKLAEGGNKVLIWTNWVNNVLALKNMLSDLNALEIFGGIPVRESDDELASREKHIREFKTNPDVMVLVANPAACAESISLHKVCHNAIYVDRTYNAGHLMQSMDRIHRIGLKPGTRTTYHILMTEGSIDERIDFRLKKKINLLETLMEDEFSPIELDFRVENGELQESIGTDAELEGDFKDAVEHLGAWDARI